MKALLNWLDHRTGYRAIVHGALYEHVPGGARWRYVWGSTLAFAFVAQAVTGIFLWMFYSPNAQGAWESVFYLQHEVQGGWLLRGMHHYMAQAMVVLLVLHLMQVVIDGAYRAPREVNFWIGLVLMQIVLGLSLTGYLLPWDQKGYWATQVATKLLALVPYAGQHLERLVVGGAQYGHLTLTRFFALHAGLLPGLLVFFLVLHLYLFRRHGLHARRPLRGPDGVFWPDQVLRDAVACLAVLAVVLLLVVAPAARGIPEGAAPGDYLGAHLGAPADPSQPYSAARPEWYFLFLFQMLKYFPGEAEVIGAIAVPGGVLLVLFLMPLVGRWRLGHGFNVGFLAIVGVATLFLTGMALRDDYNGQSDASKLFIEAQHAAHVDAQRARDLARSPSRIPPEGAVVLLRRDPKTQGPLLFDRWCASCHAFTPSDECAADGPEAFATPRLWPELQELEGSTAPNLYGFASRAWIERLLSAVQIAGPQYFQNTEHSAGDMVTFVQDTLGELDEEEQAQLRLAVMALSAQAALPYQALDDERDAGQVAQGLDDIVNLWGCTDCHRLGDAGDLGLAPDLTGYGSREWLIGMISNPAHERFYGDNNDRMPAFAESDDEPDSNRLSPDALGQLADWLRGDWYEPATSDEVAEPRETEGDADTPAATDIEPEPQEPLPAEPPPADEPVDATMPDEATPDEATPDEATPDEATPDEATPDEAPPLPAPADEPPPADSPPPADEPQPADEPPPAEEPPPPDSPPPADEPPPEEAPPADASPEPADDERPESEPSR